MTTDGAMTPITQSSTVEPISVVARQTSTLAPTRIPSEQAVAPTDKPTQSPTNTKLPTWTPLATTTKLPTLTRPATETHTPVVPTKPAVTSTQLPIILQPTSTVVAPSPTKTTPPTATVNFFRFAAPLTRPSEPARLEWDVRGVENVTISRTGGEWAEVGQQWNVSSSNSMEHTFPVSAGGWEATYVLTSPESSNVYAEFTVTVPCEHDWVFGFDYPSDSCPGEPLVSVAAFQPFEDGFMLWTQELDQILYSTWNGIENDELIDSFDAESDPIRLTSIAPPTGYLQPEYGFGKLWRTNDFVRQTLGWAVSQPINFTSIRQAESSSRSGNYKAFIGLPDDNVITIDVLNQSWSISYPKPNVLRAEQRPPTTLVSVTPPALGEIGVTYFRLATQPTKPTDNVVLEWAVDGAETIEIVRSGGEWNQAQATYELSAEGTLPQSFIPELGGWPIFYVMTACNETQCIEETFSTELPCEYPTIIDGAADSSPCLTQGLISNGSQQNFENGFMIWIEAQDIIIYSTWNGLANAELIDTFEHGVDPIRDETLIPPDGLYQPEYGFGKVWREQAGVRELLGWATDWGNVYTVKRQSQPPHRYGFREWITLKDNGLITMNHPDPIWVID